MRDKIRRELAISALRDAQNTRVTQPTTAEIEKYYGDHQAEFRAERGVALSIIVTDPANNGQTNDAVGDAQAEQKIKSIYEQLKGGSDFATVASQGSEDPNTALRGGSLGFRTEDQLRQTFPTRPDLVGRLMRDHLAGRLPGAASSTSSRTNASPNPLKPAALFALCAAAKSARRRSWCLLRCPKTDR